MMTPEAGSSGETVKPKTYLLVAGFSLVCGIVLLQVSLGLTVAPRILGRLSVKYPLAGHEASGPSLRLAKGLDPGGNASANLRYLYEAAAFEREGLAGAAHLSLALAAHARGETGLGEAHEGEAANWSGANKDLSAGVRERFDAEVIAFPARKAAAVKGAPKQTAP